MVGISSCRGMGCELCDEGGAMRVHGKHPQVSTNKIKQAPLSHPPVQNTKTAPHSIQYL